MPKKKPDINQTGLFEDEQAPAPQPLSRGSLVVPFGKFKDQPADLLLANADYALWLLNAKAAMLRRSHPSLYHWLVSHFGAPDTTPEHNRLQNRFLDDDFCLQLCLHLNPGLAAKPAQQATADVVMAGWKALLPSRVQQTYSSALESTTFDYGTPAAEKPVVAKQKALRWLQQAVDNVVIESVGTRDSSLEERAQFEAQGLGAVLRVWAPVLRAGPAQFEVEGADVQFEAAGALVAYVRENTATADPSLSYARAIDLARFGFEKRYRVEVKPFVGDDYPVVLRAMVARNCNVLLVDAFEADGASWEQVASVFASRKIRVALLEDVLLTPIPPELRVLPIPELNRAEMMRLASVALDEHLASHAAARAAFKQRFS